MNFLSSIVLECLEPEEFDSILVKNQYQVTKPTYIGSSLSPVCTGPVDPTKSSIWVHNPYLTRHMDNKNSWNHYVPTVSPESSSLANSSMPPASPEKKRESHSTTYTRKTAPNSPTSVCNNLDQRKHFFHLSRPSMNCTFRISNHSTVHVSDRSGTNECLSTRRKPHRCACVSLAEPKLHLSHAA